MSDRRAAACNKLVSGHLSAAIGQDDGRLAVGQRVRQTAERYGTRMRALGVPMDLAPVADLKVKGGYIASLHRASPAIPKKVAAKARAWRLGMRECGRRDRAQALARSRVGAQLAHGTASVPPLTTLEDRDMRPFNKELVPRRAGS